MKNAAIIGMGLPLPDMRATLRSSDAVSYDIRHAIQSDYRDAVRQTKTFSKHFLGASDYQTAYNVWKFLREHITYLKDPKHTQMVRLPSRLVKDGKGDCKSYALFAASVLANLGMPVAFRYASYDYSPIPSHVYVTSRDEQGNEIIIDGVLPVFNKQKHPTSYFDEVMKVVSLSGFDDGVYGKKERQARRAARKKGREIRKAKRKARPKKRLFKKIGLAVPRRAFRTLVALNVRSLATNLKRAIDSNPGAVEEKWRKLGGNFSQLKKSVLKGARKKRLGEIGDPAAGGGTVALLVAAAPILIALLPLLKRVVGPKGDQAIDTIIKEANEAVTKAGGDPGEWSVDPTTNPEKFEEEPGKDDTPGFNINPLVLALGLGGLFVLFSKK